MSKNNNKSKKPKKIKAQDPFDAGLDAEQVLADTLCNKFLQVGVEQDAIDEAFVGAFKGLAHRMLRIFKNDYVFELVSEMAQIVEEEHTEEGEYVCDDCKEIHGSEPVKKEPAHRGTVH